MAKPTEVKKLSGLLYFSDIEFISATVRSSKRSSGMKTKHKVALESRLLLISISNDFIVSALGIRLFFRITFVNFTKRLIPIKSFF